MARQEDSGLIDLDALLRQASESERELARPAPPPPAQAVPVAPVAAPPAPAAAAPPPPAPAAAPPTPPAAPAPAAAPPSADESVPATSIRTVGAANASALIATPPRSSRRTLATVAALAALLCAALIGYRASSGGDVAGAVLPAQAPKTTTARAIEPPTVPDSHASPGIAAGDLPSAPSPAPSVAPEPARHAAQPSQPSQLSQPRVAAVALPDSPKAELSDLGAAMRGAVGANDGTANGAAPIATGAAARTLHPSPGAMVGAINGVLPEARACLGADDPVRVASVTFRSDGAVALVEFDGERATDACVRSALARSRVEPFVDPSFVTRVTVRP
jgi:hypothetical protein